MTTLTLINICQFTRLCFPNFLFKIPNFGKLSVPNPKNCSKSSSGSLNLGQKLALKASFYPKKSVQRAPNFGANPFYKPPLSALPPLPKPQLKPPRHLLCR